MQRAWFVVLALLVGACDDETDKALDESSALTDRLCACPDLACGEKLKAELDTLKEKRQAAEPEAASGKQTARAVKLALRWDECWEQVQRRAR